MHFCIDTCVAQSEFETKVVDSDKDKIEVLKNNKHIIYLNQGYIHSFSNRWNWKWNKSGAHAAFNYDDVIDALHIPYLCKFVIFSMNAQCQY